MDKPVDTNIDKDTHDNYCGSLLTLKGKKFNTDTSKITDEELFKIALMAVLAKEAESEYIVFSVKNSDEI